MPGPEDNAQDMVWVRSVQLHDDRAAFAQLVRRHQGALRALLRRLCDGHAGTADELAQESLLQAYLALPGFRGDSAFRTWLYRLAYNVYLQHRRRGGERLQREADATTPEAADLAADEPPLSHSVALSLDLQRALARLGEAEREAIVLCHLAALSHAEAAAVTGWPLGTVKTHVLRGKAKLRASLAAWAPAPDRLDTP